MSEVTNTNPPEEYRFKPGQSGNPAGKPKGTRNLSSIIQELQEDIDWQLTSLKDRDALSQKYGKKGMKALVYVAYSKALGGDIKAMEWLAKHGYGLKVNLDFDDPRLEILEKYGLVNRGEQDAGQTKEA